MNRLVTLGYKSALVTTRSATLKLVLGQVAHYAVIQSRLDELRSV